MCTLLIAFRYSLVKFSQRVTSDMNSSPSYLTIPKCKSGSLIDIQNVLIFLQSNVIYIGVARIP